MKKKLFSLLIMACIFSLFDNLRGHDNKNSRLKSNVESLPVYLQEKRILTNEKGEQEEDSYVVAYIEQVCDKKGAIEQAKNEWLEKHNNTLFSKQIKLYPNPRLARFFEWLESWRTWNSEPSDLEIEYRKLDNWHSRACAERRASANEYEKYVVKTAAIKQDACKRLKKECVKNFGLFRKIGKLGESGPEILSQPDKELLQKCEVTIEKILFPKMLDTFHNHGIPITKEEALRIFEHDPKFLKNQVKFQKIVEYINAVVEQHEKSKTHSSA